jgi:hypothetical protein
VWPGVVNAERLGAEADDVAVTHHHVRAFRARLGSDHDAAAEPLLQEPRRGDVVGVDVGLERVEEPEAELVDQCGVARDLLEDAVDEDRLARGLVGEEIRPRRRLRVEELTEEHA